MTINTTSLEEYLRTIVGLSDDPQGILDEKGYFLLHNKAMCEKFDAHSLQQRHIDELNLLKENQALDFSSLLIENEDLALYPYSFLPSNGEVQYLQLRFKKLQLEKSSYVLLTIKDYQDEFKQELVSSYFHQLVENLEGAIVLEDDRRRVVVANQDFCDIFHIPLPPSELTGMNCAQAAEQSKDLFLEPEVFLIRLQEILEEKKIVKNEILEMVDGRLLERNYLPVFVNERYAGHFWNYQDVTSTRKAAQQLRESEEKLRLILDNTLDAVVGIDQKGAITMWNPQAEKIFGREKSEALGAELSELIIPRQHRDAHKNGMKRFFKTFQGPVLHNRIEITALRKNGEEFPVELTIIPNKIDGQYFFSGFLRDITARKEAQNRQIELLDKLENANQSLKDFAHIVSHDLKAPLRGIKSLASWIQQDYEDLLDEEGKGLLQLLQGRVERMHQLVEGILQYSQIGRKAEESHWLSLTEIFDHVLNLVEVPENARITIQQPIPELFCEKTKIIQVFQNLISNAIRYNDQKIKVVDISFDPAPKYLKIRIQDNGIGIEKKYFDKIFQIFQTLHSKEEYNSTGIGLALVKKIVESCGGFVHLFSIPGEGSTFTLSIPNEIVRL